MSGELRIRVEDLAVVGCSWVDVCDALAEKAKAEIYRRYGIVVDQLAIVSLEREEFSQRGDGKVLDHRYEAEFEILEGSHDQG